MNLRFAKLRAIFDLFSRRSRRRSVRGAKPWIWIYYKSEEQIGHGVGAVLIAGPTKSEARAAAKKMLGLRGRRARVPIGAYFYGPFPCPESEAERLRTETGQPM